MDVFDYIERLDVILSDALMDDWRDKIHKELPPDYQSLYEDNASVNPDGNSVTLRLKKKVPNFIEFGLGPNMGDDAQPYDLRQNNLTKGRMSQVIQVEPGKWRTMSWKGKPWIHPGFKANRLMDKVASDLVETWQATLRRGR